MGRDSGPIRYFAYLRKSTEDKEKQTLSIPAQRARIAEMFGGLDIEFIQEERSAFLPYNRPLFADMLARIRKGERIGLIAWHPDRLSRNEVDASAITYMLRTGEIPDLKFATYYFENNSPEAIWMLQIALSQSQYESAKKGRDVKRGLRAKAEMGVFPAPAPLGYRNDKYEERGKKQVYVDEERFALIRKMVDLMLTGTYTVPQILDIATNTWGFRTPPTRMAPAGRKLARSTLYKIFANPFYYGEFEYPSGSGNWHKGTHKPLLSRDEYDRVQFLLGRRGSPRPKTSLAFRGLIQCGECGARVTVERKTKRLAGGGVACYTYYHCTKKRDPTCSQRSIEERDLEKQINRELRAVEIPAGFKEWVLSRLQKMSEQEISHRKLTRGTQRKEYDACLRKLDKLIDMRANGELDQEQFLAKKRDIAVQTDRLWTLLKDGDVRVSNWLETVERALNFAENGAKAFAKAAANGDLDLKRAILGGLGSNCILKDGKLSICADILLVPLRSAAIEAKRVSGRVEPPKEGGNSTNMDQVYDDNPRLLRVVNDVRKICQSGKPRMLPDLTTVYRPIGIPA